MLGFGAKVNWVTVAELKAQPPQGTKKSHLFIFDESDVIMIETPLVFEKLIKGHPIIALTATPGDRPFEQQVFEALDFNA